VRLEPFGRRCECILSGHELEAGTISIFRSELQDLYAVLEPPGPESGAGTSEFLTGTI
jgi:hypothetical protein